MGDNDAAPEPFAANSRGGLSTRSGPSVTRERELLHFMLLSPEQQVDAIRRLSAQGMSDFTIAAASRLSIEMVRHILLGGDA